MSGYSKHAEKGAGAASLTHGPLELPPEHMARTHGVIPPGSVPPPDAERKRDRPCEAPEDAKEYP